jgi:hypothetical protein
LQTLLFFGLAGLTPGGKDVPPYRSWFSSEKCAVESVLRPEFYNKLPEELKNEGNEKSFVRRLKKILKDNAFFDIHEFMRHDFD